MDWTVGVAGNNNIKNCQYLNGGSIEEKQIYI